MAAREGPMFAEGNVSRSAEADSGEIRSFAYFLCSRIPVSLMMMLSLAMALMGLLYSARITARTPDSE